ncbi:MAG: hypothetical protein V1492_02590, partial [Candidatus Micrarchaeota archaeon]
LKYPTGKYSLLRDYLDKKIALDKKASFLLFLSDIADEQQNLQSLTASKTVIADRYVYSTIAYELGALGFEKSKKLVDDVGFVKPDAVILLDMPPEAAQKRKIAQKQLDRYEADNGYMAGVRSRFLKLAEERFHAKKWIVINADQPVEKVAADIKEQLSKIL